MKKLRRPGKKTIGAVVLLVLLVAAVFVLYKPAMAPGFARKTTIRTATLKDTHFRLELARTAEERMRGLSGRDDVPADTGMLFVFEQPGMHCFWMKDTSVSLDMLWFDADYKLIDVEQNVSPDSYPHSFCPDVDAQYVVELRAGRVAELNVKIGDVLTLN